jgi:alpha-mannosidase
LFFDHDWTADGNVISRQERAAWGRKIAAELSNYVDTLYNRSMKRLGTYITRNSKGNEEFFVFNQLGWMRTDYSDYPYFGNNNIQVKD